jgi:TonB-dependent receptor
MRLATIFFCFFLFQQIYAQTSIIGKVTDASDGSPLWGTNIMLAGTSAGTTSDKDGRYRLSGISEGESVIVFRYLGYRPDSIKVNVVRGRTLQLDVKLSSLIIEGEEVVVSAQLQGQTAAINQQIQSNTIVNIVSSDKIQELPDANLAESLSRLPGISVQRDAGEGSKVVVRGLSPKFNSVTINGERIPATDPNDRSVDLSMISQDILAGIEVYKALTPDMDADAIGGTINLVTRNAPENFRMDIRAQGGYNHNENDYGQYKLNLSTSNRFFNKLGALITFSAQNVNRSSDVLNAEYTPPTSQRPQIEIADLNLADRLERRKRYSGGLNLDYSLENLNIRSNNFFSQTDRNEIRRRKSYRTDAFRTEYDLREREINTSVFSTNFNGDYFWNFFEVTWQTSYSISKQRTPYLNYARFQEVGSFNAGLIKNQGPEIVPQFAKNDLNATWFQYGTFNPQFVDDRDLTAQLNFKMPFSFANNIAGNIKTGGKFRDKNRVRDIDEYRTDFSVIDQIAAANPGRWSLYRNTNILIENFIDPSFSAKNFLDGKYLFGPGLNSSLLDQFHSEFQQHYTLNGFVELGDYEAGEKIFSGYIMSELHLFKNVMFLPGIRYERTENDYLGKFGRLRGNLGQIGTIRDTTGGQKYEEFLPMIHLRYKIINGLDIRMAYTKSLSRPDYYNLVPFENINEAELLLSRGNPDLKHTTSENYDVFLSVYNRYGLFTAGAYYKKMNNVDYLSSFREVEGQFRNYRVTQPVNSPEGKVYGYEFDIQSNFSFFPSPLDGIIFNVNLSRIYSETNFPYFTTSRNPDPPYNLIVINTFRKGRLPGQADWIWNLAFGYEKKGFSGRMSFLHQGEILQVVGERSETDAYTKSFTRVDLSFSQKILQGFSVFLNANNITNINDGAFLGSEFFITNEEYFGWTIDVGFSFNIR